MDWKELSSSAQLAELHKKSFERPLVIFKHSTRCSISSMAKSRLERSNSPEEIDFYYLDLIRYRPLSDQIAKDFDVWHESPQILIIENGACIYDESHTGINMAEILTSISR
ncbi:bacillithiol system redox-active protein YtxJ [Flavihumibacter sp. ZG627]|uniref:bacillithiol system redox-active protein YtxJ n=1 Tax=Flavihumibacter sp. ZG627 TaxID=1463156 RepID=UPI00057C4E38|nr:bacillithiol system redox-active protein YtxJ [Flavihumibacter sp. ZG627]KIC90230.1 bacillithiol system protein YtxJ [Flavihumibacter sp. ZG627]